ncbi:MULTISPECIES: heme-binding domain-containing protein [Chryseobacterium]|uniref:heme-binding domain-containing protein n=1 Tax=Chryseobacterium TaxID=59732 RepID=UPI00078853C8|nr:MULTISPECIES: heme-binding domain-containing protein [Chryseobacterium]KYH04159.1 cytochrome C [Chryseobacterium cucumeris]MDH5036482.1 heme-binding domain-containing protein [Chryseobacterium cucumeris]QWT85104.1 heme-binding domain-containing protein [Chryseobacterium sp. PCH239]WNI35015.1 heme-binding domain-containing protein [Chryseobacterium sp. SG20098]
MKIAKKIIFWTLVAFALIQFFPIDRTNQPVDTKVNFVDARKSPEKIRTLLKNACYDCHSNETVYPKYAFIAPVSWSVKSHVNEGREHLNFSVWGTYNKDLKENMLTKSVQTIQNKTMPMPGYIVYHKEANLSEAERALLIQYFEEMLKTKTY